MSEFQYDKNKHILTKRFGDRMAKKIIGSLPKGSTILSAEWCGCKRTTHIKPQTNIEIVYKHFGVVRRTLLAGYLNRWYR